MTPRKSDSRLCRLYKIDGVGVDLSRFHPVSAERKNQLRADLGFDGADFILLYVAEFIPRKNHRWFLRRIPRLRTAIPRLKVVFAGKGALLEKCRREAERAGLSETVFFPGYRRDIDALCQMADVHISVSRQEGQVLNNIEAMASGCR